MKKKTLLITLLLISTLFCYSQSWTWSEDQLSYARVSLTASVLDDSIFYSGGGLSWGNSFSNTVDIYDVGDDVWSSVTLQSTPRWGAISVAAGDKVFIAGGNNYPASGGLADVDIYNKADSSWSVEYLSVARSLFGGAVTCGNKVFFAGGLILINNATLVEYSNVIDIYDLETETWSVDTLSSPRGLISAVVVGNKVYFAGGATGNLQASDTIDIYDVVTDEWTMEYLSEPRAAIAAVTFDNEIYFAGGTRPAGSTCTVIDVYDTDEEVWKDPIYLSIPRIRRAMRLNDALVFAGMCNYITLEGPIYIGPASGIMDIYYPNSGQWANSVPPLYPARVFYADAVYEDKAYIAGGSPTPGGAPIATIDILKYEAGQIHVPGDQPTIQAAIDIAAYGDTILVDEGTYYENINFKGKAITVASQFLMDGVELHIENTIIDGSQSANPDMGSVVTFDSGEDTTSIICGFTIQNGTGTYPDSWGFRSGGGIFVQNSGAKIIHNRIIENHISNTNGASGGGLFADTCFNRLLVVKSNTISENSATNGNSQTVAYGGGAFISMPVFMQYNIFTNNEAVGKAYGAGLATWHCTGTIKQNHFEDNHAEVTLPIGWGGGVYIESPKPGLEIIQNTIIDNSCFGAGSNDKAGGLGVLDFGQLGNYYIDRNIIKDNIARIGAGVSIYGPKFAHITNNVIQNNEAVGSGGGIYLMHASSESLKNYSGRGSSNSTLIQNNNKEDGMHQIINNTITQNTASVFGGGIASFLIDYDFLAFNNIIYDNSAVQGDEIYLLFNTSTAFLYYNDLDIELIVGDGIWVGDNNNFIDPEFDIDGYHLLPQSQCIEAGILSVEIGEDTYYCPDHDFDGQIRPLNSTADIGADEVLITGIFNQITSEYNSLLHISPNPCSNSAILKITIAEQACLPDRQGFTIIELFEISGKKVISFLNEIKKPGTYKMDIDLSKIPAGVYFCVLKTNDGIQTKKIVKL